MVGVSWRVCREAAVAHGRDEESAFGAVGSVRQSFWPDRQGLAVRDSPEVRFDVPGDRDGQADREETTHHGGRCPVTNVAPGPDGGVQRRDADPGEQAAHDRGVIQAARVCLDVNARRSVHPAGPTHITSGMATAHSLGMTASAPPVPQCVTRVAGRAAQESIVRPTAITTAEVGKPINTAAT